ncbi:MAG: SGNH/GDSL hydrolase family protein, partial [Kiritimatiellaeota bacterium]|nr:SGNH/GDSL hydrolase family protein [Kiritimatiellota bacterium]
EVSLRVVLARQDKMNSLDNLKEVRKARKPFRVTGTHPLVYIIDPSDDPFLMFELQKNMDKEFGGYRVRTNAEGMRSHREYPKAKGAHTVRIIGVGDSGLWGWDVEQGQDTLTVLESNLNARADGVTYEALNMAVPGYNTSQEVEMLAARGLAYKPDIVLLNWCINDFELPFCSVQTHDFKRCDVSFMRCLLFQRDKFYRLVQPEVLDKRCLDPKRVPAYILDHSGPQGVRLALQRLKDLSAREGFHALVYGPMEQAAVDICQKVGVPYYNTYDKIPADQYPSGYIIYFMHPAPGGHRVIAEHLETEFRLRGWLPSHS